MADILLIIGVICAILDAVLIFWSVRFKRLWSRLLWTVFGIMFILSIQASSNGSHVIAIVIAGMLFMVFGLACNSFLEAKFSSADRCR